jgi:hypothetical protein
MMDASSGNSVDGATRLICAACWSLAALRHPDRPRQKTHFASRFKQITLSCPSYKNIALSIYPKI